MEMISSSVTDFSVRFISTPKGTAASLASQVTKTVKETRDLIKNWKRAGKTIGLVPTMGFLHEGHASLIKRCREENDIVVVSDFVNPTQFGPTEDLEAFQVQKHHIDTNEHVNNCQYVQMAMDYLPANYKIYQMRAEYKQQARLNNRIFPGKAEADGVTKILLNDRNNEPYAVVEFMEKM